ncbi:hypothetical protein IX57_15485 [Paracoccus sanguinis]|uniref:SGNH hydrolase-like domain-containing protein, acetyltransferase AlgX n=2 Tax=Paracoccus sanguinis TaxID=1545044 RepID=A0A1H3ALP1_9RHOB|nr:hypothetical protein IX57_15485 [Paracoccus sanguinis]SDX30607.1 SGNH hydrolase-like domain-containing protein, acetyltransferase AlgX [Paracoccus sanguinis]
MGKPGEVENDVLFGEDGWLYLWQGGQAQFDFLTGARAPASSSVQNFAANLAARRAICDARGLSYVHVVYPSKPVVMTGFLPEGLRATVQSLFQRHYAPGLGPDAVAPLYPRETLIEASRSTQVFSRHDTHMTAVGNAVVAQEILRALGHDHDPQACMDAEIRPRRGDLADMAGIRTRLPETFLIDSRRSIQILDNRPFLPSNTDNVAIAHNPRSASARRLLALGDSFLRDNLPTLATFYRDILYVRSDLFQPELLDLFGPDDVVTANAERYLARVRPDAEAESVVMRGYGREDYRPAAPFVTALRAQISARAYPAVYRGWAERMAARTFDRLGVAEVVAQLSDVPGAPGWLEATGNDPRLVFPDAAMEAGRDYELRIVMESTVEAVAQLFWGWSGTPDEAFHEQYSIRTPVGVGLNDMVFPLKAEGRGRRLRFDPLNAPGRVRLVTMELSAVPSSA